MRRAFLILIPFIAGLGAGPALAAETQRYQMEKTDKGYVRMDTQTGEMSICEERDNQLVCKLAADERSALQDELGRVQSELKALDERIVKLENSLTAQLESKLPTEEEFQKSIGYMERFFRSFMGIVKDMEKEDQAPQMAPAPNKT
ncbi:hypothetical protein [Aminobacter aminovorans]|uniref:Flagellar motility protein MotE (MotC chaperone) n=1 Tax=Aminobacter aminovorans TaxID=83263 RepID=A0AAC8YU18_AMIAI|nr:hypothetical protein [Aminobacter aminovorans]AMS44199.1 hypothetical protein AA2016_5293 [Aminobacter aminovorans]MBB3709568.1 flagellar motility protein MotE (MotC chaperone) [Aminobacter aminovorans]